MSFSFEFSCGSMHTVLLSGGKAVGFITTESLFHLKELLLH